MINPTEADIGRKVIYTPMCAPAESNWREEGVITSFNEHYVFVRYDRQTTSAATARCDLEWAWRPA